MTGEAIVRFTGNTTGEAGLKFLPSGVAVASVTVAVTGRKKDASGTWSDAGTIFYRCSAWRDMAEHVTATLTRSGIRVTVEGRLTQARAYESGGETRVSLEVDVDTIGPDLRFSPATVPPKADRGSGFGGSQDRPGTSGQGSQADPWAAGASEPPF